MLQETLRALIEARGAAVVDDPDEFRAALDDFLGEHEATLGELNLLVDAVRLGAVRRLLEVLDHGGAPGAAVADVGAALARDRGTDDPARARWAVAVLGYALGRVGADVVPQPGAQHAAPPPPPAAADPTPAPVPAAPPELPDIDTSPPPATVPEVPSATPTRPTTVLPPPAPGYLGAPQAYAARPTGPAGPPRRGGVARALVLALVVALVAGAAVAGVWWWSAREDDDRTSDARSPGDGDAGGPAEGAGIPESEMVVSFVAPDGDERVYRLDPGSGATEPLTAGPTHQLPNLPPDRRSVVFLDVTEAGRVPYVLEVEDRSVVPLLDPEGPCRFSGRPAWSHDGSQIALVCENADRSRRDLYVAPWGELPLELTWIARDDLARETPTWVSAEEFVYVRHEGGPGNATGLWRQRAEPGSAPTRLTPDDGSYLSHPAWSPERDLLLYMVHGARGALGRLWVMDADGGARRQLSDRRVLHPAWSPDGRQIVFAADVGGAVRIFVAPDWRRPDRAEAVEPDGDPGSPGVPAWSSR